MILAGVHGDEYEPMVAIHQLYNSIKGSLLKGSVLLVPIANESAYHCGTRLGSDGLDMARVFPGNREGSATQKHAFEISSLIRSADYLVDMHTGGLLFEIFPLAGYLMHSSTEILRRQEMMALSFGLPVIWGTDHNVEGRTLSVARDAKIPAIYVEYGGGGGINLQAIHKYYHGCLNILRQLQMIEGNVNTDTSDDRYWVEDTRSNSGWLQGMMPAPISGIFMPAIELGQMVNKGDAWGSILDPLTRNVSKVTAEEAGLAFMIRKQVKVLEGESLGGILPISCPGKKTYGNE